MFFYLLRQGLCGMACCVLRTAFSVTTILQTLASYSWSHCYKRFDFQEDRRGLSIDSLRRKQQVVLLGVFVGPFFLLSKGAWKIEGKLISIMGKEMFVEMKLENHRRNDELSTKLMLTWSVVCFLLIITAIRRRGN
jgi:hypothetical protein